MTEPLSSVPSPVEAPGAAGEDVRIEHLLVTGLDHYFAGEFDAAINLWTRVLFLDRASRSRSRLHRTRAERAGRASAPDRGPGPPGPRCVRSRRRGAGSCAAERRAGAGCVTRPRPGRPGAHRSSGRRRHTHRSDGAVGPAAAIGRHGGGHRLQGCRAALEVLDREPRRDRRARRGQLVAVDDEQLAEPVAVAGRGRAHRRHSRNHRRRCRCHRWPRRT